MPPKGIKYQQTLTNSSYVSKALLKKLFQEDSITVGSKTYKYYNLSEFKPDSTDADIAVFDNYFYGNHADDRSYARILWLHMNRLIIEKFTNRQNLIAIKNKVRLPAKPPSRRKIFGNTNTIAEMQNMIDNNWPFEEPQTTDLDEIGAKAEFDNIYKPFCSEYTIGEYTMWLPHQLFAFYDYPPSPDDLLEPVLSNINRIFTDTGINRNAVKISEFKALTNPIDIQSIISYFLPDKETFAFQSLFDHPDADFAQTKYLYDLNPMLYGFIPPEEFFFNENQLTSRVNLSTSSGANLFNATTAIAFPLSTGQSFDANGSMAQSVVLHKIDAGMAVTLFRYQSANSSMNKADTEAEALQRAIFRRFLYVLTQMYANKSAGFKERFKYQLQYFKQWKKWSHVPNSTTFEAFDVSVIRNPVTGKPTLDKIVTAFNHRLGWSAAINKLADHNVMGETGAFLSVKRTNAAKLLGMSRLDRRSIRSVAPEGPTDVITANTINQLAQKLNTGQNRVSGYKMPVNVLPPTLTATGQVHRLYHDTTGQETKLVEIMRKLLSLGATGKTNKTITVSGTPPITYNAYNLADAIVTTYAPQLLTDATAIDMPVMVDLTYTASTGAPNINSIHMLQREWNAPSRREERQASPTAVVTAATSTEPTIIERAHRGTRDTIHRISSLLVNNEYRENVHVAGTAPATPATIFHRVEPIRSMPGPSTGSGLDDPELPKRRRFNDSTGMYQ